MHQYKKKSPLLYGSDASTLPFFFFYRTVPRKSTQKTMQLCAFLSAPTYTQVGPNTAGVKKKGNEPTQTKNK